MSIAGRNVVLKVVNYHGYDKTFGCDVLEADRGFEWGDSVFIDIRYALHGSEGWDMPPEDFIGKCIHFETMWAVWYMGRDCKIVPMKDEWLPEASED